VEVKLSWDLKEMVDIQIDNTTFTQKGLYLNLANTCYHCQFVEQNIRDLPLLECNKQPTKEVKPIETMKKDECTIVVKKGKRNTSFIVGSSQDNGATASIMPQVFPISLLMLSPFSNLKS
jgi:hypothetical protein